MNPSLTDRHPARESADAALARIDSRPAMISPCTHAVAEEASLPVADALIDRPLEAAQRALDALA